MIKLESARTHPAKLGADISVWLKEQGYVYDMDYTWTVNTKQNQLIIAFKQEDVEAELEVAIKLRWG